MQEHHGLALGGKQDASNAVAQLDPNFPNLAAQVIDQRHAQRPPELHGLDVFADGLAINGRQVSQPLSNGFCTGISAEKSNIQDRIHEGQRIICDTRAQWQCPVVIGIAAYKGKHYPGEHQPIIEQALWDQVQATLARKDVAKRANINRPSRAPALLKGLIFASDGYAMTPGHSVKNGKRYRYYVNISAVKSASHALTLEKTRMSISEQIADFSAKRAELLGKMDQLITATRRPPGAALQEPGPIRSGIQPFHPGEHHAPAIVSSTSTPGRWHIGILVDGGGEILGDEFTAARADTGDIQFGDHPLGDRRREITETDQFAHRHFVGNVGEDRILALVQQARIQSIRRRRQADDFQQRVQMLQPVQEPPVHRVRRARNQMRLVDQHEIALLALREGYDDGGFSGGNVNRPGLQRLLEDTR